MVGKFVTFVIVVGLIALVWYAVASGLFTDVVDPFVPPGNPHP